MVVVWLLWRLTSCHTYTYSAGEKPCKKNLLSRIPPLPRRVLPLEFSAQEYVGSELTEPLPVSLCAGAISARGPPRTPAPAPTREIGAISGEDTARQRGPHPQRPPPGQPPAPPAPLARCTASDELQTCRVSQIRINRRPGNFQ